jgi:hypothetical protein
MDWYVVFVGYFLLSSVLVALLMYEDRIAPGEEPSSRMLLTIVFLLGPLLVFFFSFLKIVRPASGDPFDIVYAQLDEVRGKTAGMIRGDIRLAGQSLGAMEAAAVRSTLRRMAALGYAHEERFRRCNGEIALAYRKGLPPKKRTLKEKLLGWLSGWQPSPTRA